MCIYIYIYVLARAHLAPSLQQSMAWQDLALCVASAKTRPHITMITNIMCMMVIVIIIISSSSSSSSSIVITSCVANAKTRPDALDYRWRL